MKPRISTLAFLEFVLIAVTICGTALLWAGQLQLNATDTVVYSLQALIPAFCFVASAYFNNLYDRRVVSNFEEFGRRLPQTFGIAFLLITVLYVLFPRLGLTHQPFPAGLWGLLVIVGWVAPVRLLLCLILKSRPFAERILIVGTNSLASTIAERLVLCSPISCTIIGFVTEETALRERPVTGPTPAPYPVLGSVDQLATVINETRPDRVIIALRECYDQLPVRELIAAQMAGLAVEDGIEVHEQLSGKLPLEYLTPVWLLFCKDFKNSPWRMAWSRTVSLVTAALGLLATAPLMVLIAAAIKLDSKGPVFFRQERVGLKGRSFYLVKFRTMHPANGKTSEWAKDNDHRITRVGKWLRDLHLDELPQFINVLRGDMDLVGPRPHPVSNFQLFSEQIPYYSLRSTVRPGITGWAQVRYGYANDLEQEIEKMRYDLFYIKHMSFWLNLVILLDTVKIHLRGGSDQAQETLGQPSTPGAMGHVDTVYD
jgi:exopolysaccharide biosynthesis polyprenyl glycosylphosphotransferase